MHWITKHPWKTKHCDNLPSYDKDFFFPKGITTTFANVSRRLFFILNYDPASLLIIIIMCRELHISSASLT